MAKMRGVLGAIDGTYVPIKAPQNNPHAYINRKCFYGVTLQAICDHQRKFTDCYTGWPSSVSDTRIFKNSDIYRSCETNPAQYFEQDQYIIGDKAYPVKRWCIPPYIHRGNLLRFQTDFNTVLSKTRQIIERAFALLFGRFRRLRYLDMHRMDLLPATIIGCCVLHNICLNNVDELMELYEDEGRRYVHGDEFVQGVIDVHEHDNREGEAFRDQLARNLIHRHRN
ncbi:unnamed protein product [Callosobruchus maculatus]|uniref:DDE Tnp4 domain-containing protein n=2 Tax=Callosobruchus maculatus TaxID=64391 RepID=A0A653CVC4_CALMS|nr:unnamed protein product [Callosobruchus maculatus]